MTDAEDTPNLSEDSDEFTDGDEEREYVLYQYFDPTTCSNGSSAKLCVPDTVLQAHVQLAVLRLDAPHALVGLLDRDSVHIVAHATPTADLEDPDVLIELANEFPHNSVICRKRGGLLEYTIRQRTSEDNHQPEGYCEVLNVWHDPQWSLPAEAASFHSFRYYCGVPITTDNNVSIGVLFVLDSKPRPPISATDVRALRTLSRNVMVHLEGFEHARKARHVLHMHACTAELVNLSHQDRNPNSPAEVLSPDRKRECRRSDGSQITQAFAGHGAHSHRKHESPPLRPWSESLEQPNDDVSRAPPTASMRRDTPNAETSLAPDDTTHLGSQATDTARQRVFDAATHLLREALDLQAGGGVVLLDTTPMELGARRPSGVAPTARHVAAAADAPSSTRRGRSTKLSSSEAEALADAVKRSRSDPIAEHAVLVSASVAGLSGFDVYFGRADSSYQVIASSAELRALCRRYPKGKAFDIPTMQPDALHGHDDSYFSDMFTHKLSTMTLLQKQFPGARQVLFVPLRLRHTNRWTCVFAYSTSLKRHFGYDTDFLPMTLFCNILRMEIQRRTVSASPDGLPAIVFPIPHELRSPLHGLIASIGMLKDTECNSFQRSCVDTIDACARTLFDTLSMILDLKEHRSTNSNGSRVGRKEQIEKVDALERVVYDPSLTIENDECDIALVVEECVDALASAHLARYMPVAIAKDATTRIITRDGHVKTPHWLRRVLNSLRPDVEIIMNIEGGQDWRYETQPAAVRRIVIALFSNALKYTRSGIVAVSVRLLNEIGALGERGRTSDDSRSTTVEIRITDTGCGISPQFLQAQAFTPFAQEDPKAPGNGLGLYATKSLVDLLEGDIKINSVLNIGTTVTVTLPVKRSCRAHGAATHAPQHEDPDVAFLRSLRALPQAVIFDPAVDYPGPCQTHGVSAVYSALSTCLRDWFGMAAAQVSDVQGDGQLVFVDETHIPNLLALVPEILEPESRQIVNIMCSCPARQMVMAKDIERRHVEAFSKPFGPYKLARTICRSLKNFPPPTKPRNQTDISEEASRGASILPAGSATVDVPANRADLERDLQRASQATETHAGSVTAMHANLPSDACLRGQLRSRSSSPRRQNAPELPRLVLPRAGSDISEKCYPLTPMPSEALADSFPGLDRFDRDLSENLSVAHGEGRDDRRAPTRSLPSRMPRLLLVDDNRINLTLLQTYVQKRGFGKDLHRTAENGLQAVELFQSFQPDIIFMDLNMPVMDGLKATQQIRELQSSITRRTEHDGQRSSRVFVIVLTGDSTASDRSAAAQVGVDMYMTKSFSLKQIGKILEEWQAEH